MKQPLSAVLLANEVTYQRCKMALSQLAEHHQTWRNSRLVDVLFQEIPPKQMDMADEFDVNSLQMYNQGLNAA